MKAIAYKTVVRNDFPLSRVDLMPGDKVFWTYGKTQARLFREKDRVCVLIMPVYPIPVAGDILYERSSKYAIMALTLK